MLAFNIHKHDTFHAQLNEYEIYRPDFLSKVNIKNPFEEKIEPDPAIIAILDIAYIYRSLLIVYIYRSL